MVVGDNMITLEDIKGTLDRNFKLNDEIRDNLYGLIHLFNNRFPNISLENLNRNLETLEIVKSNKFINKRVAKYNPVTNILEFNVDRINEDYDMKHVLMHQLLNIITNNGEFYGFNKNNKFEALNDGYAEIITNNLVGNESDNEYLRDEVITTNMIALMVGNDVLFDAYFNNNVEALVSSLINEGVEV